MQANKYEEKLLAVCGITVKCIYFNRVQLTEPIRH